MASAIRLCPIKGSALMVKYFFRRFFRGCISVVIAIALIMMMVFSWLDDTLIFAEDEQYVKLSNNQTHPLYVPEMGGVRLPRLRRRTPTGINQLVDERGAQ